MQGIKVPLQGREEILSPICGHKIRQGLLFSRSPLYHLPPRPVVISERAADVLLRDAAPEARDVTRVLAEESVGPDADFTLLAQALLAAGEGSSLLGLLKLSAARALLLEDAYLRAGAEEDETAVARAG